MKPIHPISLACLALMIVVPLKAAVVAEWTFNTGATSSARLASSGVASGASVSGLTFNDSFSDFGVGTVPNDVHDGFGFGGNSGDQVIFLHRAAYFDGSSVPSPRPSASDYTAWGNGSTQGTGADLSMDGNAPISFTVSADAISTVTIDSLTVDRTGGGDLIFQFQEAEAAVGTAATLDVANPLIDVVLGSPVVIGPGDTKTFTINLNSGNLNSAHLLDGIALNGTVIPEPSGILLLGLAGLTTCLRRRR